MLLCLAAALTLQQVPAPPAPDTARTVRVERRDTYVDTAGRRRREEGYREPVTEEHLRTAFRDPAARTLLLRAREARLRQDSAIVSYDAMAYQRISAGLGIGKLGRDRLIFRTENASRVRWHRDVGALIDVKGMRTVLPGIPKEGRDEVEEDFEDEGGDMAPIPYHPGHETLWIGTGLAETDVDADELVHPIARGAEAYYVYESGDEVSFRLPDGREIRLRELKVRPRRVQWNLVVGSLWFDAGSGQLVRAGYRFAEPLDIWAKAQEEDPSSGDEVPAWVKPMIMPMRGQITAVAVEYGLHQGRFWLPRIQAAEGSAQASFLRVPFKLEQSFRYAAVNAPQIRDSMPAEIPLPQWIRDQRIVDSLPPEQRKAWRDSVRVARREASKARADSIKQGLLKRVSVCDTSDVRTAYEGRAEGTLRVYSRTPCDRAALVNSPELPKSIFDDGEELFDAAAREALIAQAISLGAQPPLGLQPPKLEYGLQFVRFNRVEGLSVGARAEQQLGSGLVADATLRFGVADREPNADVGLARTNLAKTVRLGAYNRLVSANDWGNPLSFGSSLSAFLWGRDEGFYYRATGAELTHVSDRGARVEWRLFGEQQRSAAMETSFSLAKLTRDVRFMPNIVAQRGTWAGGGVRAIRTFGLDPRGWRAFGDFRMEGAGGETSFGRAALDVTLSRALGPTTGGAPIAALTLAGGSSAGDVPVQRLWYLGGTHTVRGQPAGSAAGNAFWLTRGEIALERMGGRVSLFGDLGWAGSREALSEVGRPLSGVGTGWSILDGLVRFDIARGIHPSRAWRTDLYLEARF